MTDETLGATSGLLNPTVLFGGYNALVCTATSGKQFGIASSVSRAVSSWADEA